jgi:hypothetical protein
VEVTNLTDKTSVRKAEISDNTRWHSLLPPKQLKHDKQKEALSEETSLPFLEQEAEQGSVQEQVAACLQLHLLHKALEEVQEVEDFSMEQQVLEALYLILQQQVQEATHLQPVLAVLVRWVELVELVA